MTEGHVFDLLPGYALEILDESELLTVARHLPRCQQCLNDLEEYLSVRNQLGYIVPGVSPDTGLKQKVLARVQDESRRLTSQSVTDNRISGSTIYSFWERTKLMLARHKGYVFAVIAFTVIFLLTTSNYLLWQRVSEMQRLLPSDQVLLARLDGTTRAPDATGYVMVFRDNKYGSLTVENAPVLDDTRQYQIWLIRNGERTSGGVFSVNSAGYGVHQVYTHEPLDLYNEFGITVEPVGGSSEPTGERILQGGL
jgi:anti-sigma-K factor RskA